MFLKKGLKNFLKHVVVFVTIFRLLSLKIEDFIRLAQ